MAIAVKNNFCTLLIHKVLEYIAIIQTGIAMYFRVSGNDNFC